MPLHPHPPLVLTGPPAVGKSSAARSLAAARPRCAVIEVDDLRQLITSGGAGPSLHHEDERRPPPVDLTVDVTGLDPSQQAEAVDLGWSDQAG